MEQRRIIGTGKTKRLVREISAPFDDPAAVGALLESASRRSRWPAAIEMAEAWAQAVLARDGVPFDGRRPSVFDEDAYATRGWYAREILGQLADLRVFHERGEMDNSIFRALHLGSMIQEARDRFEHEEPRLAGLYEVNNERRQDAERRWAPWRQKFRDLVAAGAEEGEARQQVAGEMAEQGHIPSDKTLSKWLCL